MVTTYPHPARNAVTVPRYRLGDLVRWETQAGGHTTEHVGRVVAVPPPSVPWRRVGTLVPADRNLCFDPPDRTRDHLSYLVEVPGPGRGRPRLYYPRVPALERLAP